MPMGIMNRFRTALGWATADRRAEAKGRLGELDDADMPSRDDAPADEEELLDQAELHVRADHGQAPEDLLPDDRPAQDPPATS